MNFITRQQKMIELQYPLEIWLILIFWDEYTQEPEKMVIPLEHKNEKYDYLDGYTIDHTLIEYCLN